MEKKLQPEWSNPPTVADLRNDLTEAQSDHNYQCTKIDEWLDNLTTSGSAEIKAGAGRSKIVPKVIRKHAEWRYASLSEPLHTSHSLFSATPVSAEDGDIAAQDAKLLEHQFTNEIDKTALIDEAVRTGVDEGTIVYRVGWEHETEKRKFQVVEGDEIKGTIERDVTTVSRPSVEVVPFKSFILDPNARGQIKDAQFAIFRFPTNISKLKAQGYENLDEIDVASTPQDDYSHHATDHEKGNNNVSSFQYKDLSRKEFTAYEYWGYWDINDDQVLVPIVATFVDNIMIRLEENPFPKGELPFVITQYLPVRGKNYGEPDGVLLEDNQKIIGALTRGMLDVIGRSANGQIGYMEQALDVPNQLKFEQGKDYKFRQGIDPKTAFYNHTYPELSSTGYTLLQQQSTEAESMTGIQTFGEGITGATLGDTAAGVNGALSAAAKRESGILRRIASGLEDIGRKVMEYNAVFLEPEMVERITNKPYVNPLPGLRTTDVKIKIRTAEEDAQRASDLAFIGQTTEDPGLRQLLTSQVAELKNMPDVAEMIKQYQPQPDPLEEQIKVLESQLLEAKIANEQGKAHNNQGSGILDIAKANTEVAKKENIEADTELKQLEFVEEETGTNHARAKDLIQSQAEGNMHAEALKKKLNQIDKPNE